MAAISHPFSRVCILVPSLNEARHIETTVRSLLSSDDLLPVADMIVADGGSDDGTQAIVKRLSDEFSSLRMIHNPGKTQAAAMNMLLDAEFADYDVIVRADCHAEYPANFVADVMAALAEKNVASIVIPMDAIAEDDTCFQRGLAWVSDTKLGAGGSPHRGGASSGFVDHGHHAGFRMDVFRELGGYDVGFVANEDAEYDRRLTNAGYRIWLSADIRIGYFPRRTARALWVQYFRYGEGRAQTCLKHGIFPKLRQMIPVAHVLLMLLSLVLLFLSPIGLIWPSLYGALIFFVGLRIAVQHRSLCGLLSAPALAIMHTSWGLGFLKSVVLKIAARRKLTS